SNEINFIAAKQRCPNWCWAACAQMVLNYHGLYVTQEQIVQKIYGGLPCKPGNAQQIMAALSGWAPDTRGRYSQIYSQYGVYSGADIVDKLSRKWPIIVGLQNPNGGGHAYVLTAIYYSVDQMNNPIIDQVVLRNPWPTSPSKEFMKWNVFLSRKPQFFKVWVNRL
ncbi:MAG: C39 family peptidase, partial [Chitinophagaceae bacterium]|nr:C39 family peptidase [Chitinophagaceae bacterium]